MDLLHEVSMDNCKGVSTLMTSTIVFDPSTDDHLVDGSLYRETDCRLLVYYDSDWPGDPHNHTWTTIYVIYLDSSPISWSSNKQRSVSCSSTKAEYRAVPATVSEIN
uniref:Uncharacterized protein n=1 Tax=Solanum lycopersicum TaxID=4081 RepID=A0A3Q7GTT6_SOLLC